MLTPKQYLQTGGQNIKIQRIGHACFCITSQTGLKVITDPYEPSFRDIIQYGPVNKSADIVTVSHDHGDHNHLPSVHRKPAVVKGPGDVFEFWGKREIRLVNGVPVSGAE